MIWKERYLAGETARDISKDFPEFNENTISRHIRQMGISRNGISKNIYDNSANIIEEYLKGMYCEELAKKYLVDVHTIYRILDKNNIPRKPGRHSSCNEDYFQEINTPNKAYLLGFITADGSITGKYSSACNIEIHKQDIELLHFIQQEINPNQKIFEVNYNKKSNVRIVFNSKKLCDDLIKYGVVPNKSKILKKVPIEFIPDDLLCYYFRGLIDGDGCVHKNGGVSIYSGSREYIESVQSILVEKIKVKKLKIYQGTSYFINWASKEDRLKLYNFLYKDILNNTFYYKRKYQRLHDSLYGNI